jgi:hypothetical protein
MSSHADDPIDGICRFPAPADIASWQCSHRGTSLILVGGPAYNAAAGHYQDQEGAAHFAFVRGDDGLRWCVKPRRGRTSDDQSLIESREAGRELGFVQRIICKDTGAYPAISS